MVCMTAYVRLEKSIVITIQVSMGNCIQQASSIYKKHPSIGNLQICGDGTNQYYKVLLSMSSQDSYIQWTKQISKLRFSSDSNQLLYLPVKEAWRDSKSVFESRSLQLVFQAYEHTLFQTVMNFKDHQIYAEEKFLWRLCYSLLKYLKKFKNDEFKLNTLCFQNILLQKNGVIKFVTDNIISRFSSNQLSKANQLDQEIELTSTSAFLPKNERCSPLQIAGIICLSAAGHLDVSKLNGNNNLSWEKMNISVKREALRNCQLRYSSQLIEIMSDMLNTAKQCNPSQILCKIQAFNPEVQLRCYNFMLSRKETAEEDKWFQIEQIFTSQKGKAKKLKIEKCLTMNSVIEDHKSFIHSKQSTKQANVGQISKNQVQTQSYLSIL